MKKIKYERDKMKNGNRRENRGMRNIEGRRALQGWGEPVLREGGPLYIKQNR
jgi:hypothetical protein